MQAEGLHSRVLREVLNDSFDGCSVFAQGDVAAELHAPPAIRAAVDRYLHYERDAAAAVERWKVHCAIAPLFAEAHRELFAGLDTPCFDYGELGAVLPGPSGNVILHATTRSAIAVDRRERVIGIVAYDSRGAVVASHRTLRHLLTGLAIARGAVPLHAAAVSTPAGVLAFCGDKGAGKSTSLLAALLSRIPGLRYVSNDRVMCRRSDDGIAVGAWPTTAGFGGGALSAVRGLSNVLRPELHLTDGGLAYLLMDHKLIERVGTPEQPGSRPTKIRLTPGEIEAAFGVPAGPGGPLRTLVSVSLDLDLARSRVEEVPPNDVFRDNVERRLRNHPDWLGVVGRPWEELISASLEQTFAAAPSGLRALRLTAGRDMRDVVQGLCAHHGDALSLEPPPRWHFGVYAAIVRDGNILAVHKTRGPYEGLLDLPGGRPEPGESLETALARELDEEIRATIESAGPWHQFDLSVVADAAGRPLQFRHAGAWRTVVASGVRPREEEHEDVRGAEWVPLAACDASRASAPLQHVARELSARA